MRPLLRATVLLVLASGLVAAAEIAWNPDALTAWIGKYPTTTANGTKSSILEQGFIKHYLKQAIPEKERRLLNDYDVERPVRQIGGFIVLTKCRPHNCPSEFAMIVIDLEKPRLWAGFFSRETGRISTRWYGNADDYSVLPHAIQREFVALHGD